MWDVYFRYCIKEEVSDEVSTLLLLLLLFFMLMFVKHAIERSLHPRGWSWIPFLVKHFNIPNSPLQLTPTCFDNDSSAASRYWCWYGTTYEYGPRQGQGTSTYVVYGRLRSTVRATGNGLHYIIYSEWSSLRLHCCWNSIPYIPSLVLPIPIHTHAYIYLAASGLLDANGKRIDSEKSSTLFDVSTC